VANGQATYLDNADTKTTKTLPKSPEDEDGIYSVNASMTAYSDSFKGALDSFVPWVAKTRAKKGEK
jgi:hypothetical protein